MYEVLETYFINLELDFEEEDETIQLVTKDKR